MAPIVHGLEAEYGDRVNFVYLDIDDPANNRWRSELGFTVQPDFYLVDAEGKVLQRWTGRQPAEKLAAGLKAALGE